MDFPLWFDMFLGCFAFSVIMSIVVRFLQVKNSQAYVELPKIKKDKLIRLYTRQVKIFKIMFWLAPLYLLVIPILIYKYAPTESLLQIIILEILAYIGVILVYMNRKHVINLLKKEAKAIK